jgi:hypothetical protein
MDAAEVKAFQKRKKNFKPSKIEDIAVVAKTKMVTAPGRNPTNKKVRVLDRPVKKRKKKMVNTTRGFSEGGMIVASQYKGCS